MTPYELRPIEWVESPLVDLELGRRQGDEGAPQAWLAIDPSLSAGTRDIQIGSEILVRNMEAFDGTPIVDVKPVLDQTVER